jgi:hypothetical protein
MDLLDAFPLIQEMNAMLMRLGRNTQKSAFITTRQGIATIHTVVALVVVTEVVGIIHQYWVNQGDLHQLKAPASLAGQVLVVGDVAGV